MRRHSLKVRGFSILELMVTIAIVAIVSAIALPGMRDLMARNKVSAEVNRLVSDLLLARNTAITRGTFVTICRSTNQIACLGGSANRFDAGWMTYASTATRIPFNSAVVGNDLLKVGEIAAPEIQIQSIGAAAPDYITYLSTGRVDPVGGAGNIVITICLDGLSTTRVPGRRLTLSVSGRPALTQMAPGACNI